jgi:hypothetical protein
MSSRAGRGPRAVGASGDDVIGTPAKAFNLKLSFSKSRALKDDVIEALEAILKELRKAK